MRNTIKNNNKKNNRKKNRRTMKGGMWQAIKDGGRIGMQLLKIIQMYWLELSRGLFQNPLKLLKQKLLTEAIIIIAATDTMLITLVIVIVVIVIVILLYHTSYLKRENIKLTKDLQPLVVKK